MRKSLPIARNLSFLRRRYLPSLLLLLGLAGTTLAIGCAALTNPGVQAIPVRLLPPEMRGESVEGLKPIPLALLGQENPSEYRIDAGDVLGVWIEGVLGERGQQPPTQPPVRLNNVDLPPATGFPIEVRKDGTISLPLIDSIKLAGATFKEAETAIRRSYEQRQILQAGRTRIIVSLIRPRTYHILVMRQDSPQPVQTVVTSQLGGGGPEYVGVSRKGTGWELILPAYQNDIITALAKSGGLPGTDALDKVIVERNGQRVRKWELLAQEFQVHGSPAPTAGSALVEIPLRMKPGTPLPFRAEDVILRDGDVVFIPAREERLFFTGGLLASGEHLLPRDRDLDVLEAVARVRGVTFSGAFSVSNLSGNLLLPGLGQPTPSLLTIIRRPPGCTSQVSIRVDLNRAAKDARERILVQAGDFLILQETPGQATVRYVTQMVSLPFTYRFLQTNNGFGGVALSVPGGQAPNTIAPIGFAVNQSSIVQQQATSSAVTPIQTPVPTTTIGGR